MTIVNNGAHLNISGFMIEVGVRDFSNFLTWTILNDAGSLKFYIFKTKLVCNFSFCLV